MQDNDPYASVNGFMFVLDCAGITAAHLAQFTVSDLRTLLIASQKAMPMRLRNIVLLNAHPLLENFLKLLMPFIPEKLKNRVSLRW